MQTSRLPALKNPFLMPRPIQEEISEIAVSKKIETVLAEIASAEQAISREDFLFLVARVFEHSAEDGLKLSERIKLTPDELLNVCARGDFALKHPHVFGKILSYTASHKDELADQYQALEKAEQSISRGAEKHALKLYSVTARGLYKQMEEAYEEIFATRKIKAKKMSADFSTEADRLTESYLAHLDLAWQGGYYSAPLLDYVAKKLDAKSLKSKKWHIRQEQIQFLSVVTTDEIDQLCQDFKLDAEELKRALKSHKYVLYGDLLKFEKGATVLALKQEIIQDLEDGEKLELNPKTNKYEIVDDEELLVDDNEDIENSSELTPEFEAKILDYLEKLLKDGAGKDLVALGLAGLDSSRAWEMRERLLGEGADKGRVALGLSGVDSPRAWEMRERLLGEGANKGSVARGLAGLDSSRAWEMRERLLGEGADKGSVVLGLSGVDSPRAWEMRERLLKEGVNPTLIAEGLAGLDSPRAWEMRERLLGEGADKGSVVLGLSGVDSPRAWEMRERLLKEGVNPTLIARGLAGLDSPRAWEMRERLLGEGADKDLVALGLAGLDSSRAWEMRERLLQEGADKDWVALGLAGDYITFVWQLRGKREKRERKPKKRIENSSELTPEFEAKILDYLEKLLKDGADKGLVVQGMAGLDSPRAWEMRERLLGEGADKDAVVLGLAGVDSFRAWEMRERLLKVGADKGWVARGLVELDSPRAWEMRERLLGEGVDKGRVALGLYGVDSPRAWEMRERLLQEGTDKDWVAEGLAGLDSPRAWEMRERLLGEGADKGWVALGLSGVDSPRAWEMRERLLKVGADKGSVAIGLAGVDSPRAWEMRERLLKEGDNIDRVAIGLVGLDSPQAWEMRERLLKEGANPTLIARGLAGLDSPQAWEMRERLLGRGTSKGSIALGLAGDYTTFVWQLRGNGGVNENEQLDLLNLVHDPDQQGIKEYFANKVLSEEEQKKKERSLVEQSQRVAEMLNRIMREIPEAFLATMGAKRDRAGEVLGQKLVSKMFPEIFARENREIHGGGFFGFLGAGRESSSINPEDYFSFKEFENFDGGGKEMMNDEREVLEFRENYTGLVVTGLFGASDATGAWRRVYLPLSDRPSGQTKETTIILPKVRKGANIILPKPLNATHIPERVRGIKHNDAEIELKLEQDSLGIAQVRNLPEVEKVAYSVNLPQNGEPMENISLKEYDSFRSKLCKNYGSDMIKSLAVMPEEIDTFLTSPEYLALAPRDRVMAIERFVRSNGFYDFDNHEVAKHKTRKSLEDKMMISELRVEELRAKNPENQDLLEKRWAGVCADFAEITCAILRRAGFLAGVAQGFALHDEKTAKVKYAHATAFVVWPDNLGGNRAVIVDGTPGGNDTRLRAIALPTLAERVKLADEAESKDLQQSEEILDEYLEILKSGNEEAIRKLQNGKLENALNVILKFGVKKSHTEMIAEMLNFYWYGGLARKDELQAEVDLKKTMEDYLILRRGLITEASANKPGGKQLFEMVEEFVKKFEKGKVGDYKQALDKFERIMALAGDELEPMEKKSMVAVITYLRGKKMGG